MPGSDYSLMARQTVTFLPGGPVVEPIPIFTSGSPNGGPDKTLTITLSNPVGPASLGTASAVFTIDESVPSPPAAAVSSGSPGADSSAFTSGGDGGVNEPNSPFSVDLGGLGPKVAQDTGTSSRGSGELDPSIGDSGIVNLAGACSAGPVVVDSQGDLIAAVASSGNGGWELQRSCGLDNAFASNTSAALSGVADITALAAEPDGSVLVVGDGSEGAFLMHLTSAGTEDGSFGGNGGTISLPSYLYPQSVAVYGSDIFVGGESVGYCPIVAEYSGGESTPDWTVDGDGGNNFAGMAVQATGNVVLAEDNSSGTTLLRFTSAGGSDTFGTAGNQSGFYLSQVLIQSDDSIVEVGSSSGQLALFHCDSDAQILSSDFGAETMADSALIAVPWTFAAVEPNDQIVLAGTESGDVVVGQLGADGNPDLAFGTNGLTTTLVQEGSDGWLSGVAACPDGQHIYVACEFSDAVSLLAYTDNAAPSVTGSVSGPGFVLAGNPASFQVTLSQSCGSNVTVYYQTVDGSATGGTDYDSQSGSVTIEAGSTSASISVDTCTNRMAGTSNSN